METVAPRVVPQGPTVSAPPPTAQITTPPPDLQRLEIGAKLEALVLQPTAKGTAEISTPFGKLQISTNFPLPANATLQFQIIGKLPLLQLLITSVQGKSPLGNVRTPVQDASTSAQNPLSGGTASPSARSAPSSLTLTVGTNVVATKIGAGSLLNAGPSTTAVKAIATSSARTPATGATNAGPPQPGGLTNVGNGPATQSPAGSPTRVISQQTGSANPTNSGLNQPGNRFSVRIVQVIPPSQLSSGGGLPPSGNTQFTAGQSATGVVTSTSAQGHAVVQTHAGPISLAAPNPLPPGTTLSFIINGPLPPSSTNQLAGWADRNASVILETHKWPVFDDAVRFLGESHPTLAQQVTNALLPKADTTLAANLILLLSAIRGGDIRNLFGDAPVRTLQRIRPDLMNRLREDFTQMARLADDSPANDWRSYPVPFLNGQDIEQIRFYVKRRSEEDGEEGDADSGARFVVDLDLSHMGRLQLDGLVKSQKKQFDLIIRTDNPLEQKFQNHIRDIFQNAMELTDNNGGLTFQAAPANFLTIQTNPTSTPDAGLVV